MILYRKMLKDKIPCSFNKIFKLTLIQVFISNYVLFVNPLKIKMNFYPFHVAIDFVNYV